MTKFEGSYLVKDGNVLCKDGFIKGVTINAFDSNGLLVVDQSWMSSNGGLDGYLFYGNKRIKTLDLSKCTFNMYFNSHAFDSSTIEDILIYSGISIHLKDYVFANTFNLKSIEFSKLGVNSDTDYAFQNSSVESVKINDTLASSPSIGKYMFDGCSKLTEIVYPDKIVEIKDRAFRNCSSLTEFDIKESITTIGDYCFDGCLVLSSIRSYPTIAPTTSSFSFGSTNNTHAGFTNRSRTDDNGNPYNKLYLSSNNSGYLTNEGIGNGA